MNNPNSGVIVVNESRDKMEEMKAFYEHEYRRIEKEQRENNKEYTKNKWKVRLGSLALRIGFTFTKVPVKVLGKLATSLGSFFTKKILKWKNKIDQNRYEKEKNKLTANFINGEGIFAEFETYNESEIEEINEEDIELAKGAAL